MITALRRFTMTQEWMAWVLGITVFFIPFQRRFYRPFRVYARGWIQAEWNLPAIFESNVAIFITTVPLLMMLCSCCKRDWQQSLKDERCFLIGFLGVALISIFTSIHPDYPLYYCRWVELVLAVSLPFSLRSAFFTEKVPNVREIAFHAIALSAVVQAAIAAVQYFSQHDLALKMLGEPCLNVKRSEVPIFIQPHGYRWVGDYWLQNEAAAQQIIRACGTLPHANILGGFLMMGCITLYHYFNAFRRQKGLMVAIVLTIFSLFLSYSRSAIFGWALASGIWLILAFFRKQPILQLSLTILLSALISLVLLWPTIMSRGGIVNYTPLNREADLGRFSYQSAALHMIEEKPLTGVGLSNFMLYIDTALKKTEQEGVVPGFVHNIYLLIGAETGLVGLLFFIFFILGVVRNGWSYHNDSHTATALAIFAGLLFIGFCDFYLVYHQQGRMMFFLVGALLSLRSHGIVSNHSTCDC